VSRRDIAIRWAAPLALVLLGAAAYANSLGGPFVLDDLGSIRDNPHVRALWPPSHWLSLEPQSSLSGRPLVTLSMALCHAAGGLDVRVYHAVNLGLHLVNGMLLLGLLRAVLGMGPAFAGALLWTLHPLDTDAVDYLTQRTELLLGSFYLGTLLAVARERRGVAVACCALGMLCKESMVTAPVAVALWQRAYRYGSWRELFARERAFHAALAGTWAVLGALLLLAPRSASAGFGLPVTPLDYAQHQLAAVAHYLRLALWPHPLALYYGPVGPIALRDVVLPGLVVAAAAAGSLALYVRAPRLGCPAVLFFVLLAPTSSLVPIATEVAAERRMYLPLAALVAWVTCLASRWRLARGLGPVAVAVLAGAAGLATHARNQDYASAVALWRSQVAAKPELAHGFVNLGIAEAEAGDLRAAAAAYGRALELAPGDARAHYDLALALAGLGQSDGALAQFARAVEIEPRFEAGQLALARARAANGDFEGAESALRHALEAVPDSAALHAELAQRLLAAGDAAAAPEALAHARRAAAETGEGDPAVLHTLAAAEWLAGLRAEAVRTEERALELAQGASSELAPRFAEQLARYRAALTH
jgi:Flp pilus assembly protein TadD